MSGRMSCGIGDKFSYRWKGEEKRQYNEMLLQVQQTISWHKEHTRVRLQKIEDMLELAVNKLSLIRQIKQDSKEEGFLNLIECRKIKKQHSECKSEAVSQESLLNLNLRIPNCEVLGVCEVSGIGSKAQDWSNLPEELLSQETCTVEPIYDKEPGEKQESWPEQEFILKAINGGHINSPNPLPSEVCTSERSEDGDEPLHTQVIQDRKIHSPLQKMATTKFGDGINTGFCLDCPALNGLQRLCKQVCPSIMSKEDPTKGLNHNQGKDVPANYSGLETKSSHLDKKIMIIFDPGGKVQNKKSSGDNNKFKGVNRSEVKPEETVMKISLGGQLGYWYDTSLNSMPIKLLSYPRLTESYLLECFISGLQEDVKSTLRLFHLSSINQAYKQARVFCSTTVRERWPEKHIRCHRNKNDKKSERYEMHQFDRSGTSSHSYNEYEHGNNNAGEEIPYGTSSQDLKITGPIPDIWPIKALTISLKALKLAGYMVLQLRFGGELSKLLLL